MLGHHSDFLTPRFKYPLASLLYFYRQNNQDANVLCTYSQCSIEDLKMNRRHTEYGKATHTTREIHYE